MIKADYRAIDLGGDQWVKAIDLIITMFGGRHLTGLGEDPGPAAAPREKSSVLLVLREGDRCLKAIHTGRIYTGKGVLRGFRLAPGETAQSLARREGVERAVIIERAALRGIMEEARAGVRMEDDFGRQALAIYRAVRSAIRHGGLSSYPAVWLPPLSWPAARAILSLLFPGRWGFCFYAFDEDRVYASMILGFQDHDLELITTHDTFEAHGYSLAVSFPGVEAVKRGLHEVHDYPLGLGLFVRRSAWERISSCRDGRAAAFRGALKSGEAVLKTRTRRFRALAGLYLGGVGLAGLIKKNIVAKTVNPSPSGRGPG